MRRIKFEFQRTLRPLPTGTELPGKKKEYLPEYSDQRVARRFNLNLSSLRKICCPQPGKFDSGRAY
jgi:hypothetical protein